MPLLIFRVFLQIRFAVSRMIFYSIQFSIQSLGPVHRVLAPDIHYVLSWQVTIVTQGDAVILFNGVVYFQEN